MYIKPLVDQQKRKILHISSDDEVFQLSTLKSPFFTALELCRIRIDYFIMILHLDCVNKRKQYLSRVDSTVDYDQKPIHSIVPARSLCHTSDACNQL